jgi:hypothetical protein
MLESQLKTTTCCSGWVGRDLRRYLTSQCHGSAYSRRCIVYRLGDPHGLRDSVADERIPGLVDY